MSAATQNELERLREERDAAIEQVACWRERALDAEGREQALADKLAESDHALMQLGRLIAEKQADAVSEFASRYLGGHEQELAEIYAGKLRR